VNAFERYQHRLAGRPADRAPDFNIYMAFAAHHVSARLSDFYLDFHALCRANFAMAVDYGSDILQAISDPYREAADLGMEISFPSDSLPLPVRPLLIEPDDLRKLQPVLPSTGRRMSDRLEAVREFRAQASGNIPIMGWVEGALAEAADLRGVATLLTDLSDRPEWVLELLEFCTEQAIAFALAQIEAGADIIGLGDAVASQISPRMYRRFALPYEQRIFKAVLEMGALPRLHICGDTSRILTDMALSGAAIIDVDSMVDYARAAQIFSGAPLQPAVCGNIPPVAVFYQGDSASVRASVRHCLETGGPRCFLAGGCEIPDGTPHANLHAYRQALMEFNPHE
jgi:MtaA/CmuA family methyltransferase